MWSFRDNFKHFSSLELIFVETYFTFRFDNHITHQSLEHLSLLSFGIRTRSRIGKIFYYYLCLFNCFFLLVFCRGIIPFYWRTFHSSLHESLFFVAWIFFWNIFEASFTFFRHILEHFVVSLVILTSTFHRYTFSLDFSMTHFFSYFFMAYILW